MFKIEREREKKREQKRIILGDNIRLNTTRSTNLMNALAQKLASYYCSLEREREEISNGM